MFRSLFINPLSYHTFILKRKNNVLICIPFYIYAIMYIHAYILHLSTVINLNNYMILNLFKHAYLKIITSVNCLY